MTTPAQSPNESIGAALGWLLRLETFMLLVWGMTFLYMVLQDRADRQYAMERHHEMMEALRMQAATTMTQSVKVESSRDDMVRRLLKMEEQK